MSSNSSTLRASQRVVMLGLDGLSWEFLQAPLVRETMPCIAALLERSATGDLTSTIPPYTGPAWTTITTGLGPGKHGAFGFTDRDGRPVSDTRIAVPRVWDYVGHAGGRSIVVNVPLTYPARPIEGLLVSGMPAPAQERYTHPEDLAARLDTLAGGYVIDEPVLGSPKIASAAERLRAMTEKRGKAAAALARDGSWDLFAIVFVLPDRLGHPWWKYLVPGATLYDTRQGDRVRETMRPVLRALDDAVSSFLDALPAGTAVLTCSDHGFGPLRADIFFDVALAEAGLIEGVKGRKVLRVAGRMARTTAGRFVPRSLLDRTKKALGDGGERRAWTAPKYEGAIRLHDPTDAGLRKEVTQVLEGLRSPEGEPVVAAVYTREEIHEGDYTAEAPELFPQMASEDVELHEGLHAGSFWVPREDVAWGTHRRKGIVAIDGGPAASRVIDGHVTDITPTLLALLGLATEEPLDGSSLVVGENLERVGRPAARGPSEAYSEEDEAAVMEHLKGLGYVE